MVAGVGLAEHRLPHTIAALGLHVLDIGIGHVGGLGAVYGEPLGLVEQEHTVFVLDTHLEQLLIIIKDTDGEEAG